MKKTVSIPCRQAGCGHAPFDTPQGEAMHYNRVHSRKILVRKQKGFQETNGLNGPIKLTPARTEAPVVPPADKKPQTLLSKRTYTKRKQPKLAPAQVDILFCPGCLTDLHGVGVGMAMANAKTQVNGCPKCGLDLRVVAVGMAVSRKA